MTEAEPLKRVGLIVETAPLRVWQRQLVDALARLGEVTVYGVRQQAAVPSLWRRLADRVPALQPSADAVPVQPAASPAEALAAAKAARLDLVIDGTASGLPAAEPGSFELGMWSLRQKDGRPVAAPYAFLDEIARSVPDPSIDLVRDGATVLFSAHPQITRGRYAGALDRLLGIAASLPALCLAAPTGGRPWQPQPARRAAPANALLACAGLTCRDRWSSRLVSEDWIIGVIDKPIEAVAADDVRDGVHWIGPWDGGRYWADPFGVPGDPTRLLCEEVLHDQPVGTLKELTLDGAFAVTKERGLDFGLSGHLSYPFMVVNDGVAYCIPESVAAGSVVIFRASDSGAGWQRHCVALEGVRAADPTLFIHGGLYWLAYSDEDRGAQDTLFLAWAEKLEGPWRQHRGNPVKIDVRSARPGGTMFYRDGKLLRPAQDCSRGYGSAIAINRVDLCTPDAYAEEVIDVLRPAPGAPAPDGLHTLSAWGQRTLIDGKRLWINPAVLRHKLRKRLG
jgi:hypothetical protein